MLTGVCNADCPICFTDRRRKPHELTAEERRSLLREAAELGARFVYVPGEGEPTMDPGWWDFLDACRELNLPAIVFTNAMTFGDDELAKRRWGLSADEAARRLADYPVYLYAKYWTQDADLAAQLLAVPREKLPYTRHLDHSMPLGVANLLRALPQGRVGFEVVVERRNADEVSGVIAPFARDNDIPRLVEVLQHNGRTFGDPSYDATPEQAARCEPWLAPTSCRLASCKAVVTVQGFVSPRIAILEHQLPTERRSVRDDSLHTILHSSDYIVSKRYNLSCLCESVPLELAEAAGDVTTPVRNVTAPALDRLEVDPAQPRDLTGDTARASCGGGCGTCSSICQSVVASTPGSGS
jgi:hypothetical protein